MCQMYVPVQIPPMILAKDKKKNIQYKETKAKEGSDDDYLFTYFKMFTQTWMLTKDC